MSSIDTNPAPVRFMCLAVTVVDTPTCERGRERIAPPARAIFDYRQTLSSSHTSFWSKVGGDTTVIVPHRSPYEAGPGCPIHTLLRSQLVSIVFMYKLPSFLTYTRITPRL